MSGTIRVRCTVPLDEGSLQALAEELEGELGSDARIEVDDLVDLGEGRGQVAETIQLILEMTADGAEVLVAGGLIVAGLRRWYRQRKDRGERPPRRGQILAPDGRVLKEVDLEE